MFDDMIPLLHLLHFSSQAPLVPVESPRCVLELTTAEPRERRQHEVISRVKSYCATETDVQGGKKSWQEISLVSLERICWWEEGKTRGSLEGGTLGAEEGCVGESRKEESKTKQLRAETGGEGMSVLIEEVEDISSGSRPSWCLRCTAAGVRSLFQPWRQLEVSAPRQPHLYFPQNAAMCLCAQRPHCHNKTQPHNNPGAASI